MTTAHVDLPEVAFNQLVQLLQEHATWQKIIA